MDLLRLSGSGRLARADGPDGLVGDHSVVPVLDGIGVGLQLARQNLRETTRLTLLKRLAQTADHLQSVLLSVGSLGGNLGVGLSLATTLRVSNDGPTHVDVLQHLGRGLAGEGTVALSPHVLRSNLHVGTDLGDGITKIRSGRSDHDLRVVVQIRHVQSVHNLLDLGQGSVALPVSTDKELTGSSSKGASDNRRTRKHKISNK